MNKYKQIVAMLLILVSSIGVVNAQATGAWSEAAPVPAGTPTVDVVLTLDRNNVVMQVVTMNTTFDNTNLGFDVTGAATGIAPGCVADDMATCTILDPGGAPNTINIGGLFVSVATTTVTLTFDTSTAAPGTYPITTVGPTASGGTVAITAGSITITGPDFDSDPASGAVNFPTGTYAGGTDPQTIIQIDNTGATGTDLGYNCALTAVGAGQDAEITIVSGDGAQTLGEADGTNNVVLDCDATAAGNFTRDLVCTHDGDETTEANPATYNLACDILTPSPAYNTTPAIGAAIDLGSAIGNTGDQTATFSMDNNGGVGGASLNSTCTLGGADAASFALTSANGDFEAGVTIAEGSSITETISCTDPGIIAMDVTYNATLSCTEDDLNYVGPDVHALSCTYTAPASAGSPANGAAGLTGSATAPPAGSSPSTPVVTVREENRQGVDIIDLTCSLADGTVGFALDTDFTGGLTVTSGGSLPVMVTFTDIAGPATDTLNCTYEDSNGAGQAFSVALNGFVRAVVVPTMSAMGYVALMFGLLLVGFFGVRRRA